MLKVELIRVTVKLSMCRL